MTNVLDSIIEATTTAAPKTATKTTPVTPATVAPKMSNKDAIITALTSGQYLRGTAKDVSEETTLQGALAKSEMDWKVLEYPVAVVGWRETRITDNHKALVRSDTGTVLDITSDRYTPFQNPDTMGCFMAAADAMGGQLVTTAVLDEGRSLLATISLGHKADAGGRGHVRDTSGMTKGDIVGLTVTVSTGHKVGQAFKLRGQALRLACLNGMALNSTSTMLSIAHNKRWTSNETRRVQAAVASYMADFEAFLNKSAVLAGTKITHEIYKAFFLELFNPEALKDTRTAAETVVSTSVRGGVRNEAAVGAVVLENILADTDRYFSKMGRTAKRVNDLVRTQPGHELSGSTMWDALNAVTYYTDHERGREDGAAVLSALMGDGDRLKTRALDLAIEYTERLGVR